MDYEAMVAALRHGASGIRFEDHLRGAVALARLKYGLPESECIPGLSEVDRAMEVIRKTIRHSHTVQHGADQWSDGAWVIFGRHVTEGAHRWGFEVELKVERQGAAMITDVRVVRPGDELEGEDTLDVDVDDDGDDVEADLGDGLDAPGGGPSGSSEPGRPERARTAPPLTAAELLPFGMIACPCCGHATLSERGRYQICPVCFWEDDGQDSADADVARGGPNRVSLTRGRANFLQFGASVEADRPKVRAATAEEVPLRHFAPDGRERFTAPAPRASD